MKTYKAAWRYYFFLILFTAVSLVGARAVYMLFSGQVSFGEDLTAGENRFLSIFTAALLCLPLWTYILSSFRLWKQIIRYKGTVMTLTEAGVENTLVFAWLFAFVFIQPVKLIPWEAVTYYDADDGKPYIRVKVSRVKAGWLGKLILKILGFPFHLSFAKPAAREEDLQPYAHRFSTKEP